MSRSIALSVLVLCTACGSTSPSATITYQVAGVPRASLITYEMPSGVAQAAAIALPWRQTRPAARGDFLYVSGQNDAASGCIRVAILKGTDVLAENQSCGGFVIATASLTY